MTPLDLALRYIERGWNPIPVPFRSKRPEGDAWQARVIDAAAAPQYFDGGPSNIGVLLGPSSHGLTDVDLDCAKAIAIAPYILPRTRAIFGRASKRASHWLYYTDLAVTAGKAVQKFVDPRTKQMLVELRIGGDKGAQTIFPGSTHEDGEPITWEENGEPASADDLDEHVRTLAAFTLLARGWPQGRSTRHGLALVVGGFLARNGASPAKAKLAVEAIAKAAYDEEWRDRAKAAEDAVSACRKDDNSYGFPALAGAFGKEVAMKVAEWLGYSSGNGAQAPQAEPDTGVGVSLEDFWAYMPQHGYIFVPSRDLWPASSVNARVPPVIGPDGKPIAPSKWLASNRAVEQMTWAPGEPQLIKARLISEDGWIKRPGCTVCNLYRPPVIVPRAGDVSPWLDLVNRVFPNEADHIVQWLAHRVQRPHEKINHALVLGGVPGIGKDTILEPIKQAVGPWNFADVSPKQVLGRFNGFLRSVVLRVNEARDLGEFDRFAFFDHMKAYIAAPPGVLLVDEKHLKEHYIPNLCA
jgi:Bifunctional DNA primase/polymerase, N-terminal